MTCLVLRCSMLLTIFCLLVTSAFAQKDKEKDPLSFDRNIGGLLGKYCYRCHNSKKSNGDVNLEKDNNPRLIFENAAVWETALSQIIEQDMPPEDAKQKPSDEERELIVQFLRNTLGQLDCDSPSDPGKSGIRRLNRAEYDNSISYLTGLDLHLADSFPSDTSSYGFENIAASLTLTPLQVEQYYNAAQKVVDALISDKVKSSNIGEPIGYKRVYFLEPDKNTSELSAAKEIITKFASRAFRRPVAPEWIDRLLEVYKRSRDKELDHDASIGNMIITVLISPNFLIRVEKDGPHTDGPESETPYPIDAFELASRMSFFLWSGPPDEVLYQLATQEELLKPEIIDQQIDRMLKDKKSQALVENFFAPWLQFGELAGHSPDKKVFPDFDSELFEAIVEEPRLILREVIQNDSPITDLIDSKYTFVNEKLAKHYDIKSVTGSSLQRVELSDRRRGGLLTSAALLMAQSDPSRTNVPRRGNFIAGAILGAPAPPPPPNVPELKEQASDDKPMTLRERLASHSTSPQCASCHSKMDPLGFAFENYNAIGGWRDSEVGKPIDASGELPNGEKFNGPIELKEILLERKEEFARTLTAKLLIYALGRGPIATDKCVVTAAVESAKENDFRFSSIVRSIIHSYPFLHRKNPEY